MPQNILFDTKPGLLVHEWTKRFRHGPPDAPSAVITPPDAWIDGQIPASALAETQEPAVDQRDE